MTLVSEALGVVQQSWPEGVARFAASLDPAWIEQALGATGTASARKRKFPAEQAVWLVIGMGLFADRSIAEVVAHLDLTVGKTLAPSALSKARARLGPEPLAWLFKTVAQAWTRTTDAPLCGGLRVFGVDGTHLRLQDTAAIAEQFGKPGGRAGAGDAGYPQARLVTLMDVRSRLLVDARIGAWTKGEQTLAQELWASIPDSSLVIFDRGFINYMTFLELAQEGRARHWLVRAKKNTRIDIQRTLPDGSELGLLYPPSHLPQGEETMPGPIEVRIVTYAFADGKKSRLVTTLLDWETYPAKDLVALYHERWELELGYDELKVHLLERNECLRSKTVSGVTQELWGLLLLYNLVRREMVLVARDRNLPPPRVSFRHAVVWIRTFWLTAWKTSPGRIPHHLGGLRESLQLLILPPRRSERRYPRHVKIKMSNYARNRGKSAKASTITAK